MDEEKPKSVLVGHIGELDGPTDRKVHLYG